MKTETSTLLRAWDHETGLRVQIEVPFDRSRPVFILNLGDEEPDEARLSDLRRSARLFTETLGSRSMVTETGAHLERGLAWT